MPVIGRQYGASFGNLFPYHFGCDAVFPFVVLILPDGDVFHFGRDDPVSGIPQLGMEFSLFLPLLDPRFPDLWHSLPDVDLIIVVGIGAGRIVNADFFPVLQRYFPHTDFDRM